MLPGLKTRPAGHHHHNEEGIKTKEMSVITVDKKALREVLDLLDMHNLKCASCGKRVTVANYGFIHKDGAYCSSLICLTDAIMTLEARGVEVVTARERKERRK